MVAERMPMTHWRRRERRSSHGQPTGAGVGSSSSMSDSERAKGSPTPGRMRRRGGPARRGRPSGRWSACPRGGGRCAMVPGDDRGGGDATTSHRSERSAMSATRSVLVVVLGGGQQASGRQLVVSSRTVEADRGPSGGIGRCAGALDQELGRGTDETAIGRGMENVVQCGSPGKRSTMCRSGGRRRSTRRLQRASTPCPARGVERTRAWATAFA